MNKSVTKYIFPYSSFHADYDGYIHFHIQQLLRTLKGLLQPHVSLFIPSRLSCTMAIYSVLRSKTEYKINYENGTYYQCDMKTKQKTEIYTI